MNLLLKSHPRLRRLVGTLLLLLAIGVGLWTVHWGALYYVASHGPQLAFSEINLQKGISTAEVLDKLGVPDAKMHEVAMPGQPASETLRYVRCECALELVFVGGKLASWSESQPIDLAKLKHARTYATNCCEPTEVAAAPQPEASGLSSE